MSDFTMSHHASKDDMLRAVMAENEQLKAQLAAAQQWAQDAEPAAWVATFKPEGLLALHSVVGANLEELKQSVPGNSVFRPLYTHPTTQVLEIERLRNLLCKMVDQLERRGKHRDGNAPGHGHDIPGVWDRDNGELAGKRCAWCEVWQEALEVHAAAQAKQGGAANGAE